jgi:hypothetical protein
MTVISRRRWLLAASAVTGGVAAPSRAPSAREFLAELAGLLSTDRAEAFMKMFDEAMPGYAELRRRVMEMMGECEVSSGIDIIEEKPSEDGQGAEFDLDWALALRTRADLTRREARKRRVHLKIVRSGKSWKVTVLGGAELFGPLAAR